MTNLPYISEDILKAYQGSLAASPISTQKRKTASLNKFFNWAQNKGYIQENPIKSVAIQNAAFQAPNPIIPTIYKPNGRSYRNITKVVGVSLVLLVAGSSILLVRNLKIPIPFIFTPASSENNLITITDPTGAAGVSTTSSPPRILTPTPAPVTTLSPSPTISPTPSASPSPTQAPLSDGPLELSGTTINLSTLANSDGSITLNPDGSGKLNVILEGSSGNLASFLGANLNKGNLMYGYVGNNSPGYNLLKLQSGSKPVDRFVVDSRGNTKIGGNLDEVHDINLMGNLKVNGATRFTSDGRLNLIRGYYQEAGNFDIQQGAANYGLIHKTLTNTTGVATSDLLTLELDELEVDANSSKDTLVVKRRDGASDAYAIYVPNGNVQVDHNLGIGADLHINGNINVNGGANFNSQTLSESQVAHGLTTLAQTGVFYHLSSLSITGGGSQLTAISDTDAQAFNLRGVIGSTNPTDSIPAIKIMGAKSDGSTGTADLAAAETVFQIQNNDNAASFTVQGDGDVIIIGSGTTCTIGDGTGATTCTSDTRLKTNVTDLTSSIDKINALRPITFNWIDPSKDQSTKTGLIAQETQQVFPEMVHEVQNGYLGIDYAALTVPLIKAVQELDKKISNSVSFISNNITAGSLIVREVAIIEGEFIATNIKAGTIVSKNFTSDSFYAFQGKIDSLLVETKLVSPIVETRLISPLADESDINVRIGRQNQSGKLAVTNAMDEKVASIDSEGNAEFVGSVNTNQLSVTGEATVSGTLYATNIVSGSLTQNQEKLKDIEKLLKDVGVNQKLLAEIAEKADLSGNTVEGDLLASLSVDRLYITDQAAINSLSVSQSFSIGGDLVFQTNTINTLSTPLSIQSLALAPIEIMAGKIKIDTNGNIEIVGILTASEINVTELKTDKIIIASNSTQETSSTSIDGSIIETNATAGVAIIYTGSTEITIKNPNITNTTLVYVTPTSPTSNQVLYLKSKEVGSFVVGFENANSVDVNFNWWVIDTN